MSKTRRRSAKALNLLVALAMVISLSAVLAPAAVAEAPCDNINPNTFSCNPDEQVCDKYGTAIDCCELEVFVNTYVKDPGTGDFSPQAVFEDCEEFYVNAVVVNTGNISALANVTAEISIWDDGSGMYRPLPWSGHVNWASGCPEQTCKVWEDDPNSDLETLSANPGDIADFWWLVHCDGPSGPERIRVNATAKDPDACDYGTPTPCPENPRECCYGEGFADIIQTPPTEEKCLQVRIIEAPGLTHQGGDTVMWGGTPLHWDEDVPDPYINLPLEQRPESPHERAVVPCTNFGIKAMLINTCERTLYDVNATIYLCATETAEPDGRDNCPKCEDIIGPAAIVGGDPCTWYVGDIEPNDWVEVAWTVHCEDPGDVYIWVRASEQNIFEDHPITTYWNDPWWVHQLGLEELDIDIICPEWGVEVCTGEDGGTPCQCWDCVCDDPGTPTIRENMAATIMNLSDETLINIFVQAKANDTSLLDIDNGMQFVASLPPGASNAVTLYWPAECTGKGPVDITFSASGKTEITGHDVAAADVITRVFQKETLARIESIPDEVNKCQQFDVIGAFTNCNEAGQDFSNANVTIYWRPGDFPVTGVGNATAKFPNWPYIGQTDKPQYLRCGTDVTWKDFTGTGGFGTLNTVIDYVPVGRDGLDWCRNTQKIHICHCCETWVRWPFKCLEYGEVDFYVEIDTTQGTPPNDKRYTDTSDTETLMQVYKAHLVGGMSAWLQDGCCIEEGIGRMLHREAFSPCQNMHIVFPVINVGNATAEDVQIDFKVYQETGIVGYGVTWDLAGIQDPISGDATGSLSTATGLGTASLGDIPGNTMKKMILQLHCAGEGQVQFLITGLTGIDENTGAAIPLDNIDVPPCPLRVKQIPFEVVIVNPITCQDINVCQEFAVKAVITNYSDTTLEDVRATLYWESPLGYAYGGAELVEDATRAEGCQKPTDNPPRTPSPSPMDKEQALTKWLGNCSSENVWYPEKTDPDCVASVPSDTHQEITWTLHCCEPGEVYIWVYATAGEPYLTTVSDDDAPLVVLEYGEDPEPWPVEWGPQPVNVHQLSKPDICVTILSPEDEETVIATSEEFSVTALVNNTGTAPAENVMVTLSQSDNAVVVLLPGEENPVDLGTLEANEQHILTWDLHALFSGDIQCDWDEVDLRVNATTTSDQGTNECPDSDMVEVDIVPAAHLVAGITSIEVNGEQDTSFPVCQEFVVNYTVTNTGQADAWEVTALLDVFPPGSVRIAEAQGGYTQYIGNLAGWGYGCPVEFIGETYEGKFTLHCKEACESTLKIIPAGNDECGFYKCECRHEEDWDDDCTREHCNNPGREIDSEFIEPVEETVKQLESEGAPITGETSAVIELLSGWNLISLPLIPTNPAIASVCAGANINTVYWYNSDPADPDPDHWYEWSPGPGGPLTQMNDGKGYWVRANSNTAINLSGSELPVPTVGIPNVPPAYDVYVGWNMIGFKSMRPVLAGTYLAALPMWTRMYGFNATTDQYLTVGSGDSMQPEAGYWLAVPVEGTIYP